ncbi:MAG: molybdate transporter, ATP-binding protein [Deferribacteraceae bacterium]|jgi:molybdate transport system ATP-binding protein|nr:molybdate transporter, ATP-binding protein [Deferribacteraceae bacterium]
MIEIGVEKRFKKLNFSYELKTKSNKIVLFGPSGAGKSNLLKMIAGFYPPDTGIIKVADRVLFDSNKNVNLPIFHRNIGYLPQEYTLFPNMTVRENIEYAVKQKHLKIDDKIYSEILELLEIKEKLNDKPSTLSGGQKQRVAIARAIFSRPDILLFDEPFSALDKPIKEKLIDTLMKLIDNLVKFNFDSEVKSIFVTHSIEDAYLLGEEIAIVYNGKIIETGKAKEIFDTPQFLETALLLNFKNIFEINEQFMERIPILKNFKDKNYFGIRPENVMILRDDASKNGRENLLEGYVERIKLFGSFAEINMVIFKKKILYIRLPIHAFNKLSIVNGKRLTVSLKTESLVGFRGLR